MKVTEIIQKIRENEYDSIFKTLYTQKSPEDVANRYIYLLNSYKDLYGDEEVSVFSAPGRTELSGNHTDHNNGKVLAAAVDMDIIAVAGKRNDKLMRLRSVGYDSENTANLDKLDPKTAMKGTSNALLEGIADYFNKNGYKTGGFNAYTESRVATGSGLSSSAAFEVVVGGIMSGLYNDNVVTPYELAVAGKYAENEFFGKPCGLMDQMASAVGGVVAIDFDESVNGKATIDKVDIDFNKYGYSLIVVNAGGSHADLTDEYASIPYEMKAVSKYFGKSTLRYVDKEKFYREIGTIRKKVGDRATLRAIHFFDENDRVDAQREALKNGDIKAYFEGVNGSGRSSECNLQNIYPCCSAAERSISLAITLANKAGAEVVRVHGGGFAGTIQAYVPHDKKDKFVEEMENCFGENCCFILSIRPFGYYKVI